jgi:adenosylmethionine-8-amino-7-oxononanoate aminotransferase
MNRPSAANIDRLLERDARVLWHPFSHAATEPELFAVAAAEGAWLHLHDGRRVLDGISSWWTCLHGHCHPEIVQAIAEQAGRLDHTVFASATHEPGVRLAEELLKVVPRGLSRVFYSDDGSTAVEVALKMAIAYFHLRGETRRRIVALEGGYHGDTFGAMALGGESLFTKPFMPYLFRVERTEAPDASAGPDAQKRAVAALDRTLEQFRGDVAAVVTEPVLMGAGGMRVQPLEFVASVRECCDRHGVPWIADEVLTGFGRTGELFACDHAGVAPDILCLSKGLTGGTLPLSATLCREEMYKSFHTGSRSRALFHGHSYTGNPIACAAALASLELTRRPDFLPRVRALGAHGRKLLQELESSPAVREVRGIGLMAAVELKSSAGYLDELSLAVRRRAAELGVLLRPLGPVLYILPPACTTLDEMAFACGAVAQIVREIERGELGRPRAETIRPT